MQRKQQCARTMMVLVITLLAVCLLATAAAAVLVLDQSLQGSTSGTRQGGSFDSGGWRVTGQYDSIHWHLPYPIYKGSAEYYLKGINPNECRSWMQDKCEFSHMYDWTYGNADYDYGGYRDNPYKHFIRKIGCIGGSTDAMELLWKLYKDYAEPDSPVLGWNSGTNYRFYMKWYPNSSGDTIFEIWRDGQLLNMEDIGGYFAPEGHCFRIGASSRRMDSYGAPLDGVYSYVKVWDDATSAPSTPAVTFPRAGQTSRYQSVPVTWEKQGFSKYEVHITTANSPTTNIIWDSGEVASAKNWCYTAALGNNQNYYVFVRLWNGAGWSAWSATGNMFTVNTSWIPPDRGVTTISGRSFYDSNGHYLGLGATYMQALRHCKYDRDLFRANCAYLAAQGFNHIRVLTMLAWSTKEIAPLDMISFDGQSISGWSDYWQQFRDCIDIAYEYGLRTEVTVFADAQNAMPNETDRYNHLDGIVGNVGGRDHKVIFIEVANEYWQNGLNVTQLRAYGEYLTARTGRLVALSSSGPDSLTTIYSGTTADMATEHTERDIGTFEGGWLPVRSSWSLPGTPGVPAAISNDEPIGPGSSVNNESDPIKLVSAGVFSWIAGLNSYVYHTTAGVAAARRFEDMPGSREYKHLANILPPALSSWVRNDGLDSSAPFTVFCNGVANQYWTSNPSASTGCHRNIGAWHDGEFVCYPQGILSGGLTLQARQSLTFTVYNPMTGAVVMGPVTKGPGEQINLAQGPGAYIIRGTGVMVPNCASDTFTYPNGALNGNGGWYGSAGSSQITVADNRVVLYGGAGSYDAIKSMYCQDSGLGYIPVTIKVYPGSGARTIWNIWLDDTNGNNLARWYGTANSARGRIGGTADVTADQTLVAGWNTLLVKIFPASNTSQFFFNGVDIGTLSHASQGAGDILGRIRIERMDNVDAVGHYLYFDDLSTDPGDTTPPGPVTNFVATGVDRQINLSWTNPGSDFAGTMIRFSTAGFPGSPTGGTQIYDGTGTSFSHTGLTNGVAYYYSAFSHDAVPNYASPATASATPVGDTTPPGNVTNFSATSTGVGNQLQLSWTNPGDSDLTGIKVMFKTTGYPTGPTDGTQCYNALGTSYQHNGLTDGVTYYYKAFAYDEVPNYASGAQISGVPTDTQAPGVVTGFTATPSGTQNALAWTNPGGDFTGTMIRWKTTGYPTGPADGTQCYDSSGTSYAHTGLTPGVTYYYSAYAHDEVPNYSSAAQTYGTIPAAFCFQDEFNYAEGVALVGQGGWTGNATASHIKCTNSFVQVFGGQTAYNATKTMSCSGGPYIWVRLLVYKGTGTSTMWNVWINDSAGKNFARWYGSGTTARGRMGTSGTVTAVKNLSTGMWDSLVVKIDPAANTTQFYFNGEDLGVYSHGTQPGTAVGQIKIERENNSGAAGNHMYIDNIRVSAT